MGYQQLKTVFHRLDEAAAEAECEVRRRSPGSVQWDYRVGQHQLFAVITRELFARCEKISQQELRIATLWARLPQVAQNRYFLALAIGELQASNEIENIHSTRREVADALALAHGTPLTGSPVKVHRFQEMAMQYMALPGLRLGGVDKEALHFPRDAQELRGLYDALLGKEVATEDVLDGELFRAGPVVISDGQRTIHSGAATEKDIVQRIGTMIETAHLGSSPRLLNVFAEHFMFEHTHPFYDGNGRMGRFLMCMRLAEVVSPQTALSFSPELFRQKARYYRAFEVAEHPRNYGELTFYLTDMAAMLESAQEQLIESLNERLAQLEDLNQALATVSDTAQLADDPIEILYLLGQAHLFGPRSGITLEELAQHLGYSKHQTRNRIKALEKAQLVEFLRKRPLVLSLNAQGLELLRLNEPDML